MIDSDAFDFLEALSDVHGKLTHCIEEHCRRVEEAVGEQQRVLEELVQQLSTKSTSGCGSPEATEATDSPTSTLPSQQLSVMPDANKEAPSLTVHLPDSTCLSKFADTKLTRTDLEGPDALNLPDSPAASENMNLNDGSTNSGTHDSKDVTKGPESVMLTPEGISSSFESPSKSRKMKNLSIFSKGSTAAAEKVNALSHAQRWTVHQENVMVDVKKPNTRLAFLVTHHKFELAIGLVILLNAVFIVLQADWSARHPGRANPIDYMIIETMFFFVFFVEVVLQMWVFQRKFFTGRDWKWNWFDLSVVVTAAVEETVKLITAVSGFKASNMTTLFRVMRIVKLTRVVRIVRVFRIFRELRIMVTSIISTLFTLFWSIVCLVMIMSAFSVFFLTMVSDYQATDGPNPELEQYFGSMTKVMLCLFQATTGGMDWRVVCEALMEVSFLSVAMLCVFISMMNYAIMNILTGICVNTANKTAEDDFEISIHEERSRQDNVTGKLKELLHEGDKDNNGTITWAQLEGYLRYPEVKHSFKKLDLEPWHLQSFFDVLKAGKGSEEPRAGP